MFLKLEDPFKGINSPLDYGHVKLLILTLKSMCFWPVERFEEKTWKIAEYRGIIPIVISICMWTSIIAYLVTHAAEVDFIEIGHMYLTMFLATLSMTRSFILPFNSKYKDIIVRYFTSMHLFYHAHKSEYAKSMHTRLHKVCHIVSLYLFFQMMVGITLFNVIPMYLNFSRGIMKYPVLENTTFELSIYFYYPRDATTNRNSYHFISAYNWYGSYICSSIIGMNDTLVLLMVLHIYGHFKILLNMLGTFPQPADSKVQDGDSTGKMITNQMFSEAESEYVYEKLKECIDYHKFIVEFVNTVSSTFGPMLLVYYAFHQLACCLLLLECSVMTVEAIIRYGPLTVIQFQALMQISITFEIIGTVSEKLKDAIYNMPWECMDRKSRQLVLFFLMNVQNPIHVKAMGIVDVGVLTMSTILKTTVSYFTFLYAVPTKESA